MHGIVYKSVMQICLFSLSTMIAKGSIAVVALFFVAQTLCANNLPSCFKAVSKPIRASCLSESGVDPAVLEGLADGKFIDDRALKCYLKCWWAKMGVIKPDGTVDHKKMTNSFPESIRSTYAPNIKQCKDTVGSDDCETIFLWNKCLYEAKPEVYFYF